MFDLPVWYILMSKGLLFDKKIVLSLDNVSTAKHKLFFDQIDLFECYSISKSNNSARKRPVPRYFGDFMEVVFW